MIRAAARGWLLVGLLGLTLSPAAAAPAVRAYATTTWTDNLFQSYSERGEWIRQLSFDVDTRMGGLWGYYTGSVDLYGDYEDLFTQRHTIGLSAVRSGDDRSRLRGDLSATWRGGRAAYDYRDYLEGSASFSARTYLRRDLLLRGGGSLDLRDYRQAGAFSYVEPSAWVQLSRFLPSRTTLIAGADAGVKNYLHDRGDTTATFYRSADAGAQALAAVWVKAAQSLGSRTGLQLRYSRQFLWTGQSRARALADYDPTNELFDDDYSHAGSEWRATLKRRGARFEALATAYTAGRTYEGRPALDLDGYDLGATRHDRRTGLRLRLSRELPAPAPLLDARIHLDASTVTIDSNDPYYDTTARLLSLSLELGL